MANIGEKIKVKIYDQENFGRGVGKIDDKIVFVENAIPEEEVEVLINSAKSKFYTGKNIKTIKVSDSRVEYECPYYDKCGGCQIGHQSYKAQLDFKQNKVIKVLSKIVDQDKIKKIVSSETRGYRNKGTFKLKNNELGFYENETNNIVNIEKCLLMDDLINKTIKLISEYLNNNPIIDAELMIRSNGEKVTITSNIMLDNNLIEILRKEDYVESLICDKKQLLGNEYFKMNINKLIFEVSPESFFQVNSEVTEKLFNQVREYANLTGNETVLDLYCGVGTIGLSLADQAKEIIGIEVVEKAIINAKNNALLNNINNSHFIAGDITKAINKIKKEVDLLIVDPPRAGLQSAIEQIEKINANKIIYVSCDLNTLKRDLEILGKHYAINSIALFDMFPNTYHVENVVLMSIIKD